MSMKRINKVIYGESNGNNNDQVSLEEQNDRLMSVFHVMLRLMRRKSRE